MQVYSIHEIINEISWREREERETWSSVSNTNVRNTVNNNVNSEKSADDSSPVKLSRLIGVGKVPPEELQRTFKNGISVDLELESSKPHVNLPSPTSVDIEAERKKA